MTYWSLARRLQLRGQLRIQARTKQAFPHSLLILPKEPSQPRVSPPKACVNDCRWAIISVKGIKRQSPAVQPTGERSGMRGYREDDTETGSDKRAKKLAPRIDAELA